MKHTLPALPYDIGALEPVIDARTMTVHHDKHHATYVKALNKALEEAPDLQHKTAEWLLMNLKHVPENIRTAVRNNAGGHVNHSLFWRCMTAAGGGYPSGPLSAAIDRDFSGYENFKAEFESVGAKLFGSGWVWLVVDKRGNNKLQLLATTGHDNPLTSGYYPLMLNDVWEHAYYLKHENKRPEYLKDWWKVVNWSEAEQRFVNFQETVDRKAVETAEAS
jgi:Fe-Mn family superoxide dismutase